MTFIASVIAKKGVAIIADSLVTTSKPILTFEDFRGYVEAKKQANGKDDANIIVSHEEILELFKPTTSHTKDYEEKLFRYDDYIGITTAGSATINGKKIEQIIAEIQSRSQSLTEPKTYREFSLDEKVANFCELLTEHVRLHLSVIPWISETIFLLTHYNKIDYNTSIFKIKVNQTDATALSDDQFEFVQCEKLRDFEKVVCEGQSRISDRILYGDLETFWDLVPHLVQKITADHNIDKTEEEIEAYIQDILIKDVMRNPKYLDDMKLYQLTDLSLQQAVDLAQLLMKIEIDIQKYTKNIPNVGGVIKIAVIDNEGFRWVSGNKLTVEF